MCIVHFSRKNCYQRNKSKKYKIIFRHLLFIHDIFDLSKMDDCCFLPFKRHWLDIFIYITSYCSERLLCLYSDWSWICQPTSCCMVWTEWNTEIHRFTMHRSHYKISQVWHCFVLPWLRWLVWKVLPGMTLLTCSLPGGHLLGHVGGWSGRQRHEFGHHSRVPLLQVELLTPVWAHRICAQDLGDLVGIMVAVVRKGAVAGDESFVVVYCALPDAVDVHCAVSGRRSLSTAATEFWFRRAPGVGFVK